MKKAFDIILINNGTASREFITANDRADAMRLMEGKGEIVRIEDVTESRPISTGKLARALLDAGFGMAERELILTLVLDYENAF